MIISSNAVSMPRATQRLGGAAKASQRLVRLFCLLAGPSPVSIFDLQRQLGITPRMLRRDMQALRAVFPVQYFRQRQGYQLKERRYLPPLDFTPAEALGVLSLSRHVDDDPVLAAATHSALAKLRGYLPTDLQDAIAQPPDHVSVRTITGKPNGSENDLYCGVAHAITHRSELLCRYRAAHPAKGNGAGAEGESVSTFAFRPYHLLFSNRNWYVIGRHMQRRALRTLKLMRLVSAKPNGKSFRRPRSFTPAAYFGQCWRMMPGKTRYPVVLEIDAEFAPSLCETQWHSTQQMRQRPDGRVELSFKVDGLDEIVWWILGLGPHCRVLAPKGLVERLHTLAGETAALYSKAPVSPDLSRSGGAGDIFPPASLAQKRGSRPHVGAGSGGGQGR